MADTNEIDLERKMATQKLKKEEGQVAGLMSFYENAKQPSLGLNRSSLGPNMVGLESNKVTSALRVENGAPAVVDRVAGDMQGKIAEEAMIRVTTFCYNHSSNGISPNARALGWLTISK